MKTSLIEGTSLLSFACVTTCIIKTNLQSQYLAVTELETGSLFKQTVIYQICINQAYSGEKVNIYPYEIDSY